MSKETVDSNEQTVHVGAEEWISKQFAKFVAMDDDDTPPDEMNVIREGFFRLLRPDVYELFYEEDASRDLIVRQGELLRGVVDEILGAPPDQMLWGHHDAPDLARELVRRLTISKTTLETVRAAVDNVTLKALINETLSQLAVPVRAALAEREKKA